MPLVHGGQGNADLLALRRAGRGKTLGLLALVLAALVAAGASFFFDPDGDGNPDDPAKIIVVTQGQTPGYGARLRDWGFEAAEGPRVEWLEKARQELANPPPGDVAAILALADKFGYGHVVFEHPVRLDFTDAGVQGVPDEFGPAVRFAAVSAGDLAQPSRLTVHDRPGRAIRDPSLSMLQALFRQPVLEALTDPKRSSLSNLALRDRLHAGMDQLQRIAKAEALVADVEREIGDILVQSGPDGTLIEPVGEALEHSVAVPLGDGSTLLAGRRLSLVSHDGVRVRVEFDDREYVRIVGEKETLANGRLCPAAAGSLVPVGGMPRVWVAADGQTVAVPTPAGQLQTWRLQTAGECRLQGLRVVDPPVLEGLSDPAVGENHVAWSGDAQGDAVVAVASLRDGSQALLGLLEGHGFGSPLWLDAQTLLVVDRVADRPDGVLLLDLEHPLVLLRLEATVFHGSRGIGDMAVGRDEKGSFLLAVAGEPPNRLFRLDWPAEWQRQFENESLLAAGDSSGEPRVVTLDSNRFRVTVLTHRGRPYAPQVARGQPWLTFGWARSDPDEPTAKPDHEIAWIDLRNPGQVTSITDDRWFDGNPRFGVGTDRLLFATGYLVPRTNARVLTARWTKVSPARVR